ncbi:hypothetical protein A3G56_02145 [Candidatus Falkowbacteria bacterium RIFCSPLOWO2_12_FULL_45_10]|uniref:Uncharacterized protein n=3 Tax=Candidatus Falkowiibacteriota TaxID=1752728 RepID=A0A1F5RKF8_9BACT|nr:MAG: hypothetical protein A3D54_01430 [Candidatus Falkowbacteria bacterium RIFCSPHIGHO2_02_FULL_45_15]OGF18568.1 MAG: hypothetical protein A3I35_03935 [Candidatus Falkowbacteria bacterium RIFCSPLOWO2_02_FULL_45_15]OGF18864.1 MAG: hypothetical protein A3G56_02145 [Candidatus Falkowbacteria bacterium RIFCSPLOWO2_12_FULL_45_10]
MPNLHTSNHYYRLTVFWVGIIATVAYRAIVVLNYYSAFWVQILWYIGTIGFVWYFAHRFRVENGRERLIKEKRLTYKITSNKKLNENDREALAYVLKSLQSSKARWNYIAIFFFSALALIYGVYADLINFLK